MERLSWFNQAGLKYDHIYMREAEGDLTDRRKGSVTKEAEIRVIKLKAKGLPAATKNSKEARSKFFPKTSRGSRALPTL